MAALVQAPESPVRCSTSKATSSSELSFQVSATRVARGAVAVSSVGGAGRPTWSRVAVSLGVDRPFRRCFAYTRNWYDTASSPLTTADLALAGASVPHVVHAWSAVLRYSMTKLVSSVDRSCQNTLTLEALSLATPTILGAAGGMTSVTPGVGDAPCALTALTRNS